MQNSVLYLMMNDYIANTFCMKMKFLPSTTINPCIMEYKCVAKTLKDFISRVFIFAKINKQNQCAK